MELLGSLTINQNNAKQPISNVKGRAHQGRLVLVRRGSAILAAHPRVKIWLSRLRRVTSDATLTGMREVLASFY